jgi:acyl dehydratase
MTDLLQELQEFEGEPIGAPRVGPDLVNAPMIRHWCRAMGDTNPIYVDERAARAAGHSGLVAPPTMLQSWTILDRRDRPLPPYQMQEELRDLLAANGFTTVVATNCDQEYVRYLTVGDQITSTAILSSVSPEKSTRFGPGHFVTTLFTYGDQRGEVVGSMSLRCLLFRPSDARASGAPRSSTEASNTEQGLLPRTARIVGEASVGDRLPTLTIPITPTLIIAGAISTMDFNVIHHDRDRAQAGGAKDILMNILTTNGLVGRYTTDWTGPLGRLEKVALRLGVPNFPDDEMTIHADVAAAESNASGKALLLKVRGVNGLGDHAVANVHVKVPVDHTG